MGTARVKAVKQTPKPAKTHSAQHFHGAFARLIMSPFYLSYHEHGTGTPSTHLFTTHDPMAAELLEMLARLEKIAQAQLELMRLRSFDIVSGPRCVSLQDLMGVAKKKKRCHRHKKHGKRQRNDKVPAAEPHGAADRAENVEGEAAPVVVDDSESHKERIVTEEESVPIVVEEGDEDEFVDVLTITAPETPSKQGPKAKQRTLRQTLSEIEEVFGVKSPLLRFSKPLVASKPKDPVQVVYPPGTLPLLDDKDLSCDSVVFAHDECTKLALEVVFGLPHAAVFGKGVPAKIDMTKIGEDVRDRFFNRYMRQAKYCAGQMVMAAAAKVDFCCLCGAKDANVRKVFPGRVLAAYLTDATLPWVQPVPGNAPLIMLASMFVRMAYNIRMNCFLEHLMPEMPRDVLRMLARRVCSANEEATIIASTAHSNVHRYSNTYIDPATAFVFLGVSAMETAPRSENLVLMVHINTSSLPFDHWFDAIVFVYREVKPLLKGTEAAEALVATKVVKVAGAPPCVQTIMVALHDAKGKPVAMKEPMATMISLASRIESGLRGQLKLDDTSDIITWEIDSKHKFTYA